MSDWGATHLTMSDARGLDVRWPSFRSRGIVQNHKILDDDARGRQVLGLLMITTSKRRQHRPRQISWACGGAVGASPSGQRGWYYQHKAAGLADASPSGRAADVVHVISSTH
jgi:hypothetical protein